MDHPRVCGDYTSGKRRKSSRSGSPPRVRGLLGEHGFQALGEGITPRVRGLQYAASNVMELLGITPACAGTTDGPGEAVDGEQDHPRVCGDYLCTIWPKPDLMGSPPRVRGLPNGFETHKRCVGITPACAGTTCRSVFSAVRLRDHPRVCGDYTPSYRSRAIS